jgi:hypothetical protein
LEVGSESLASIEPQEQPSGRIEESFDTWPGVPVRPNMETQVDELFESEPAPVLEDVQELETNVSEDETGKSTQPEVRVDGTGSAVEISEEIIDRIAEKVLNKLSERMVAEIVWQVVPDLAEKMIRRELEKLHAGEE